MRRMVMNFNFGILLIEFFTCKMYEVGILTRNGSRKQVRKPAIHAGKLAPSASSNFAIAIPAPIQLSKDDDGHPEKLVGMRAGPKLLAFRILEAPASLILTRLTGRLQLSRHLNCLTW